MHLLHNEDHELPIQIGPIQVTKKNLNWPAWSFQKFSNYEGCLKTYEKWVFIKKTKPVPLITSEQILFDSQGSWAAFQSRSNNSILIYQFTSRSLKKEILSAIEIFPNKNEVHFYSQDQDLGYPLDELFFLYAFSFSQSFLIHSCLFEFNNEGYLFCGVSGAGKSTLSEILEQSDLNGDVLCDERNVVTINQNQIVVSSSPWFGTSEICKAKTLPLKKIFILNPSHEKLSIKKLDLNQSIAELMKVIFLPQFSKPGIKNTINTISELIQAIRPQLLSYQKDKDDVVDFLKNSEFNNSTS